MGVHGCVLVCVCSCVWGLGARGNVVSLLGADHSNAHVVFDEPFLGGGSLGHRCTAGRGSQVRVTSLVAVNDTSAHLTRTGTVPPAEIGRVGAGGDALPTQHAGEAPPSAAHGATPADGGGDNAAGKRLLSMLMGVKTTPTVTPADAPTHLPLPSGISPSVPYANSNSAVGTPPTQPITAPRGPAVSVVPCVAVGISPATGTGADCAEVGGASGIAVARQPLRPSARGFQPRVTRRASQQVRIPMSLWM